MSALPIESIAGLLFFGVPRQPGESGYEAGYAPGGWSLREPTTSDLDRMYDLPYRWAHAIIAARDEFKPGPPGLRRYEYKAGTPEEKAYAKYIAEVRSSSEPERVLKRLKQTRMARTR